MISTATRQRILTSIGAVFLTFLDLLGCLSAEEGDPMNPVTITEGQLKVVLRDNSNSPKVLSGVDELFHLHDAPDFDAFDPVSKGASAGLNFEHIISGHQNPHNAFAPRHGKFALSLLTAEKSVMLVRNREDDPWSMSSTLKYTIRGPHYIDVDFQCIPHDRAIFGERGFAVLFFANYMNDVEQTALNFRGIDARDRPEKWIAADAPSGHPDWNQGGTYRNSMAADLQYDADHNFKLNIWSYDYQHWLAPSSSLAR